VQVRSRPERERFGGHVYFAPTCVNACSITASNCPPTPAAYRERAAERRDTDRRDRPIGSLARIPRASHNPHGPCVLFFARFGLSVARSARRPGQFAYAQERERERERERLSLFLFRVECTKGSRSSLYQKCIKVIAEKLLGFRERYAIELALSC
jgi:hypothetical protein